MAVALEIGDANNLDGNNNSGKITLSVLITCIVAASGGLIFGYDIGISGGVTTMPSFLEKFFPSVAKQAAEAKNTNMYCMYDSHALTLFTSSLYIAGLVASPVASRLIATTGRKNVMLLGGCIFFAGAAMNGLAANVVMLILGRFMLGFGVGFNNQATPVYLSEVAPPKWRGAFSTGFQFFNGIGVLSANCINFFVAKHSWGWRLSLGLAAVPAAIMTIGAFYILDTPSSLVERGKLVEARQSLIKIRGNKSNVDDELTDLVNSSELAKAAHEPLKTIFERRNRPHLVMAIAIPFFQQFTGIGVVAFYTPVVFSSVGSGQHSALTAAIVLGAVNLGSILVSTVVVDRYGRRLLFIIGGIQMFICQVALSILLYIATGAAGTEKIPKGYDLLLLVFMCIYAAGFGWSWNPLTVLIPSEIFPMRIRATGVSINIAVAFSATFVLSQFFLTMLCHLKYSLFLFYGCWIAVMTVFVVVFLPETRGIPLEKMDEVWMKHWYWRRFVGGQL
ncbi:sugar transport protein 5 [Populus alba]|uniref:Hexose transport family protein n=1 Tax=Populus alba TaxID=43335 RepID=A0A4U5QQ45_POPAL|nr:sugar transport protein 5-like [Populus alba]TKS12561.1 hexose transport family protein [Populus alba]